MLRAELGEIPLNDESAENANKNRQQTTKKKLRCRACYQWYRNIVVQAMLPVCFQWDENFVKNRYDEMNEEINLSSELTL